jgi:N-acetyl-alpha-D-glucosaminyl L-malate synthase BshA
LKDLTCQEFEIRRPIEMIPNFVNCDVFHASNDPQLKQKFAPGGEKILIHISNFRPVKRVSDVIEIFDRVQQQVPARLLMVGDGPERSNAEWMVRSKKLGCKVLFLGKQESIMDLLSISDVLLLPSDKESFGLVALEAMACEVPVIASNMGGMPEVVRDGVDGYLAPPRDVETMSHLATQLLLDDETRHSMGLSARQRAMDNFCTTRIIPRYEAYYDKVFREVHSD